ncbi:inhibin beta A chain-like [Physella acuta]|uniref:inhibin beta A chain-like n=1 Tax=Physella acuta TaxID=109671 RepID=UPI0027DBBBEC|nr:inhibin beta A chain-like [Physella acuta]
MTQRSHSPGLSPCSPRFLQYSLTLLLLLASRSRPAHSKAVVAADLDLGDEQHRAVVEEFKGKILRHLGLSARPNVSVDQGWTASNVTGTKIRHFLRGMRANDVTHLEDGEDVRIHRYHSSAVVTETPVLLSANQPPTISLRTLSFDANFQTPEAPYLDLVMKSALLRMRIGLQKDILQRDRGLFAKPATVNVYIKRRLGNSNSSRELFPRQLVATLADDQILNRDVEIPLETKLLSEIFESGDRFLTFEVSLDLGTNNRGDKGQGSPLTNGGRRKFLRRNSRSRRLLNRTARNSGSRYLNITDAVLELTTATQDLRKSRRKRQTTETACHRDLCCKHSIYISFEEIGWSDWVLAPEGFDAYYCKGGCPRQFKIGSTFSGIKGLLHERNPNIPAPVCAPNGYTSIEIMHLDVEGEIVMTTYPEMVVAKCRCY